MGFMSKLLSFGSDKDVKRYEKIVEKINGLEPDFVKMTDEELTGQTAKFRERYEAGETLDALLPEAFATVREASKRTLGMRHFDVQLIGAMALHEGMIAEMKTGEGKTLVSTLAGYLNAIPAKGVHIVTVNDYLAKRDSEWMGKIYRFLGMTVGLLQNGMPLEDKLPAYAADVTYGTNSEFGFDYLRDNMVVRAGQRVQRGHAYAIVDEVDSILIDEARTPLIISGAGTKSASTYKDFARAVRGLERGEEVQHDMLAAVEPQEETGDYVMDEAKHTIAATERGLKKIEQRLGIEDIYGDLSGQLVNHLQQALKAQYMFHRDKQYVVTNGEVKIVDEFTGRIMEGRRYSEGLHQAIEAKEGVLVREENQTLATITLQNYFRMYQKLSGMTGTAKTEEDEFRDIYNMDVVVIPTNLPIARVDKQDAVYAHESGKYAAIVNRVAEVHETGQPVLVGTISVEISELISQQLKKRGIKHNVLNAKHHEREAEIVAEAGRLGAVTIATNMAGRGTDIILGGNPEFEARKEMKRREYTPEQLAFMTGITKSEDPELNEARDTYKKLCKEYEAERKPEQEQVKELGGLCIIGTERHESRRIDNQLRGRAGRQGDPGESQFFISLEDDLMRLFGGEKMQRLVERVGLEDDEAIEAGMLSKSIENAQKKVEGKNFGIRKYVLQYDNVMNKQREIIYGQRRMVLDGVDLKEYILGMMGELVDGIVDPVTMESKYPEEWDFDRIYDALDNITPRYREEFAGYTEEEKLNLDGDSFKDDLKQAFEKVYDAKEAEIGSEQMREVERMIMLRVVDNRWMDHIDAMDQLKTGIGLRGLGQQDPAMAYASEGFSMFEEMISDIREEVVKYCYNVTVTTRTERTSRILSQESSKAEYRDEDTANGPDAAPEEEKHQETVHRKAPKVGRNDPCPCGSGKKYKNCCGRNA